MYALAIAADTYADPSTQGLGVLACMLVYPIEVHGEIFARRIRIDKFCDAIDIQRTPKWLEDGLMEVKMPSTDKTLDGSLMLSTAAFPEVGGWIRDSEFILTMGGVYLLAHGLGYPVEDASTCFDCLEAGDYHVWAYTFNWVAPWHEDMHPGEFEIHIGSQKSNVLGVKTSSWGWEDAGVMHIAKGINTLRIHDLTGFEGRVAYIYITKSDEKLPSGAREVMDFYISKVITDKSEATYDFIAIGGGFAGMCSSLAAARGGLKTALVQDRPMVGGNNSSEIRVWLGGGTNYDPFPGLGNIVGEFEQKEIGHYGPVNKAHLYEDERKMEIIRTQQGLDSYMEHCLIDVDMDGDLICSVLLLDYRNEKLVRLSAPLFVDATGDGNLGAMAGADFEVTTNGHMGLSNLWHIEKVDGARPFPHCPWAIDLSDVTFPGRGDHTDFYGHKGMESLGCWFWESGMTEDPIEKAEYARDLNFRAMYGAWDAIRNVDGDYQDHELTFAAAIAGKRESRRLLGDLVLTKADFKYKFPDACAATTWNFDVHYPHKDYYEAFREGDAFITMDCRELVDYPYFLPYRILYSRNIRNMFMAGRDVSVSHDASGTARVMRTAGIMGEVVGYAARLCHEHGCLPRDIYTDHLEELLETLRSIEKKEVHKVGSTVV